MIRSILLATDTSEGAKVATTYATYLCYKLDALLKAVYVLDSRLIHMHYWRDYGAISLPTTTFSKQTEEILNQVGQALLEQVEEKAAEANVPYHSELLTGIPAVEILNAVRDCDLIVMGRQGESSKLEAGKRLGSVAERILRNAKQPVLIAPNSYQPIERVILGFDGSNHARAAMQTAANISESLSLPLLAISVQESLDRAELLLKTVKRYAKTYDLEVTTLPLEGHPTDVLLQQTQVGDLLVIGAFGEGRVREWLLGSTTEAILRTAEVPIILQR